MISKQQTAYLTAPDAFGAVCPLFSRSFSLDIERVRKATLFVTAHGVYEARLNGERVGDFVLAPGWTSYHHRLQVQEYDVTSLLEKKNRFTLLVGEGWCCGRIAYDNRGTLFPARPLVTAQLEIEDKDGKVRKIGIDRHWKVQKSKVLSSTIYEGEVFDATANEGEGLPAPIVHRDSPSLIPTEGEVLREMMQIEAKSLFVTPAGEVMLDFGQNLTGYVRFTTKAPKGTRLVLDHVEVLDEAGNAYTEALRSAIQRDVFIAGDEKETFCPHFTYHGFRYVRMTGFDQPIDPKDFHAVVLCSDMRRTGAFSCSSPLLNKLYENIIWGQMGNFLDVPTDCPQRDERLGWTGDARVFIKAAAYNFDVEKFFTKWLGDLAADQFPDGRVTAVVPHVIGGEVWAASSAWGDAATVCPWELYLAYGNKEILRKQFASMQAWVDYIRSVGSKEELWDVGRHYGDHLALDPPDFTEPHTDKFLIATACFAHSTAILIKAGEVLGKDMTAYRDLHERIVSAFGQTYLKDGEPITPTQTAYTLAICFDLAPNRQELGDKLDEIVRANGTRLTTGFVGTAYLLHALVDTGHEDTACALLLQEQFPSWLYSVKLGATTIWEHWDGMREDGSMWSAEMNSFNHYAFGAVGDFLFGDLGGIKPSESHVGYERFTLAPIVCQGLDWVKTSFASRRGVIRSEWAKIDAGVKYTFEIPPFTRAHVKLKGKEPFDLESGIHEFIV